jgi:hypothetical protein
MDFDLNDEGQINNFDIKCDQDQLKKYLMKRKDWNSLSFNWKYKNYLKSTISRLVDLLENEYGEEAKNVWADLKNIDIFKNKIENLNTDKFKNECKNLIMAHEQTKNSHVKIQLLSLIPSSFTIKTITSSMKVTKYQIEKARTLKKENGPGIEVSKPKKYRIKLDEASISCFLNFIISDDFMHDVAYGHNKIKLADNSINSNLIVPNVVRLATNASIVSEYTKMCNKENLKPLSQSTCLRILKACPASYRKCLQGIFSFKIF